MTASRTCRACGADLAPDVTWCLRCYQPVRHLTPREPQLPTIHPVLPKEDRPMSRWKAGATTFGPVGRIAVTALVLLLAPWSANVVAIVVVWPAYLVLASVVLRSTWRKDHVQTMTLAEMAATGRPSESPPEPIRTPIPRSTLVAWVLLVTVGMGVGIVWASTGRTVHALIAIGVSLCPLVLAVRWLARP